MHFQECVEIVLGDGGNYAALIRNADYRDGQIEDQWQQERCDWQELFLEK